MPTSTWFGGAVGVPRPVRMKPRTIRMRVKPVTVNSSAGIERDPGDEQQQLDGVGRRRDLHRRTVRSRSVVDERSWPAGARWPVRARRAGPASGRRRLVEQAGARASSSV